nr:GPI-anchored wall transfer protein 1 [Cryptococcus depauperatus CBS 7841]
MSDYKEAKEAFVSNNPGASIWSINAVSLVALGTYAFWLALSPRLKQPGFLTNYLLCVLPILIGVTLLSTYPMAYNSAIAVLTLAIYTKSTYTAKDLMENTKHKKSVGQWLDESDSDEEPAEPASAGGSNTLSPVRLPSQVAISSGMTLSPETATSPLPHSPYSANSEDSLGVSKWCSLQTLDSVELPMDLKDRRSPVPILKIKKPQRANSKEKERNKRSLPFLTVYRAHMMLMTVICILAVDFKVFPRWQGKCEDFGTSLMDIGVGSFVFSLGLVSTKSLSPPPPPPIPMSPSLNTHAISINPSLFNSIFYSLRKSVPILILGFIRLAMVKGAEYPEHVTEYGVHWNFFFTLAVVPVVAVGIRPLTKWLRWSAIALVISFTHQAFLHFYQGLILSPSRPNLLMANKEGLSSLPGYLSIFLLGLSTGEHILSLTGPPRGRKVILESEEEQEEFHQERKMVELAMELASYSIGWWILLGSWKLLVGDVSRRLANTPYVLWTAAYNITFLLGYLLLSYFLSPSSSAPGLNTSTSSSTPSTSVDLRVPPLLEALNKNGLVVFLTANLLTGLINISINTMYMGRWASMSVLTAYTMASVVVAHTLFRFTR